eukprot:m51a1_g7630 putative domain containing protein (657) ;mRNA; f:321189-323224
MSQYPPDVSSPSPSATSSSSAFAFDSLLLAHCNPRATMPPIKLSMGASPSLAPSAIDLAALSAQPQRSRSPPPARSALHSPSLSFCSPPDAVVRTRTLSSPGASRKLCVVPPAAAPLPPAPPALHQSRSFARTISETCLFGGPTRHRRCKSKDGSPSTSPSSGPLAAPASPTGLALLKSPSPVLAPCVCPLPDAWELREDAEGGVYYANASEGLLMVQRPRAPPDEAPGAAPLPEGWAERVDWSSGRRYYVCASTGAVQWSRPVCEGVVFGQVVDAFTSGAPGGDDALEGLLCTCAVARSAAGDGAARVMAALATKFAVPREPDEERAKQARLRICKGLLHWLSQYPEDFAPAVLSAARELLEAIRAQGFVLAARSIEQKIDEVVATADCRSPRTGRIRVRPAPQPEGPAAAPGDAGPVVEKWFSPLVLPAASLAQLIKDIDFELFSRLPLRAICSPELRHECAAITQQFLDVADWASTTIVREFDDGGRVRVLGYFVDLADALRLELDFQGCLAVVAALSSEPVQVLRHTWAALAPASVAKYRALEELCAPGDGVYARLFDAAMLANNAAVPHVPSLLQKADRVALMEPPARYFELGSVIALIARLQRYNKEPVHKDPMSCKALQFLRSIGSYSMPSEELLSLALAVEGKTQIRK